MIDLSIEPLIHFQRFIDEAKNKVKEYNAMSLATVNQHGQPSVRVVYFKGIIRNGLSFYTNYKSDKARDILENNSVSVNFFWPEMNMQIRVSGIATPLSREENESYFATRPRLAQMGAWASEQSKTIKNYQALTAQLKQIEEKFEGKEVPCPTQWGGFHIKPSYIEFWFAQTGRLHKRYCYKRENSDKNWQNFMKSP